MGNGYVCPSITGGFPGQLPMKCNPTGSDSYVFCITKWGDGWCDSALNTPECGYDGGDCCYTTQAERDTSGENGVEYMNCLDPDAVENSGLSLRIDNQVGTIKGAASGAQILLLSSLDAESATVPDWAAFCVDLELDIKPIKNMPETIEDSKMADAQGELVVEIPQWLEDHEPCAVIFQVVEVLDGGECRKSNVAFVQNYIPDLWDSSSCRKFGNEWCWTFACPAEDWEENCCQDPQYWCDVPAGCGPNDNGDPYYNGQLGPDRCREYWLLP